MYGLGDSSGEGSSRVVGGEGVGIQVNTFD